MNEKKNEKKECRNYKKDRNEYDKFTRKYGESRRGMNNPDDLSKFLSSSVKPTHALDKFVNKVINQLVDHYVVPWLVSCLSRYNEADFHARIADPYFDFLTDWKTNHSKFNKFIAGARKFRNRYKFDVEETLSKVLLILESEAKWNVAPHEIPKLRKAISDVHAEIYSDPY